MDNIILKFYSNGKNTPSQYSQFGAFSSNMIQNKNPSTSLNIKTINDTSKLYLQKNNIYPIIKLHN